jgi:hypothetical protein
MRFVSHRKLESVKLTQRRFLIHILSSKAITMSKTLAACKAMVLRMCESTFIYEANHYIQLMEQFDNENDIDEFIRVWLQFKECITHHIQSKYGRTCKDLVEDYARWEEFHGRSNLASFQISPSNDTILSQYVVSH